MCLQKSKFCPKTAAIGAGFKRDVHPCKQIWFHVVDAAIDRGTGVAELTCSTSMQNHEGRETSQLPIQPIMWSDVSNEVDVSNWMH